MVLALVLPSRLNDFSVVFVSIILQSLPFLLVGMVMRRDSLAAQEFALLRYSITHCAADARPVGVLVIASGDPGLPSGQWVEVEGVVSSREREGSAVVSIEADRVVPIEEPADAYL